MIYKFMLSFLISSVLLTSAYAQVGIGTILPEAALDIDNSSEGILLPRVSLTSLSTEAPVTNPQGTGLAVSTLVFHDGSNSIAEGFYYWNGTIWTLMKTSQTDWSTLGNSGTIAASNFIGTTDANAVSFRTDNDLRMRLTASGKLVIDPDGTASGDPLDVNGDIELGGGATAYDSQGENLNIRAQSEDWYISVANEATVEDSDFFIGLGANKGSAKFLITPAGEISIGSDDEPDDLLHITKDQDATTVIRLDNTNSSTDIPHTALNLYDGSNLEGFFRHNNFTDTVELGNNDSGAGVDFYANGGVVMTLGTAGNVNVVNNLTKGGGTFKIDHPLDPENKYLYHSFVESPDMMNMYNGVVQTDASGLATVELPEYFAALNKDFRYQLTTVGSFSGVMIFRKIEGNRFIIKSEEPSTEVEWLVTGVRKDPYANANRVIPEVEKETADKGKYLHPKAYGKAKTQGIYYKETDTTDQQ